MFTSRRRISTTIWRAVAKSHDACDFAVKQKSKVAAIVRQVAVVNGQQLSHTMTCVSDLIECAHCGHKITGERKTKKTKSGPRDYLYYRCTKYNKPDHPRTRVTEAELDRQVLAVFDKMRIEDSGVCDWFRAVLASKTKDAQADTRA